jgi:hypothetical protein
MIPTTAMTTLVNDRRQALIRQAQLHRLAVEAAPVRRPRNAAPRGRSLGVVLRVWRTALER